MAGEIADHEREQLFELVNSSEANKAYFDEMQQIWDISGEEEEETLLPDVDLAWQKVAQRIEPVSAIPEPVKEAKVFRFRQLLQVAAVFIGVLGAFWWYQNSGDPASEYLAFETTSGESKALKLPDGSMVWLNETSTLRYKKDFDPRVVELEGEAFFDVEHLDKEHTFEIQSGDTKTTVLGTSFNVRAYPKEDQVEVTVETGKVVLEHKKIKQVAKKVVLVAGESGVYKKKAIDVSKTETTISNANAWKTKQLKFNDVKISKVVEALERYYNISITVENEQILNCPYTGTYDNPKLEDMIQFVEASLPFVKINQTENNLTFSGEGCK